MKVHQSLLFATAVLLFCACSRSKTEAFLPGTYVNVSKGELSQADDTLEIRSSEASNFIINRRTGFNLIREGKQGKREYEKEIWNVVYDQASGVLTETRKGRRITIFLDSGFIKVGRRKYIKQ